MDVNITIDGADEELNIAIASLIYGKLVGLGIKTKVNHEHSNEIKNTTNFIAVTKIENILKTDDIKITLNEGNLASLVKTHGPLI